jgi:hypothetical protein
LYCFDDWGQEMIANLLAIKFHFSLYSLEAFPLLNNLNLIQ